MAADGWECRELSGPATCPDDPTDGEPGPAAGLGDLAGGDDDGGGSVGERGRVAGGDRPVGGERRAQGGQGLQRRVGPDALVGGDDHRRAAPLRHLHRLDLGGEHAGGRGLRPRAGGSPRPRRSCASRAIESGLLPRSVDDAHRLAVERVGEPVEREGVDGLDVAVGPAAPRAGQQVRRLAHRLLAAGDDDGRPRRGGSCRAASMIAVSPLRQTLLIVVAGTVHGMPGRDGRLAGGVLAGAGLDDLAHEHLVDRPTGRRPPGRARRGWRRPRATRRTATTAPPFSRAIGVRANERITTSRSALMTAPPLDVAPTQRHQGGGRHDLVDGHARRALPQHEPVGRHVDARPGR